MTRNLNTPKDTSEFIAKLPILDLHKFNWLHYGLLSLYDLGVSIAYDRFFTLHEKIIMGATALCNAYRKDHENLFGTKLGEVETLWYRKMYLEQAVESYNKVVDYVYLVLYFRFGLYEEIDKKKIRTQDDVKKLSAELKPSKFKDINGFISNCESTKNFSNVFSKYRKDTKELRNFANDLKHRGFYGVEGASTPRYGTAYRRVDGDEVNLTKIVEQKLLNLDEEIDKLVIVHNDSVVLQKELYILCNFEKCLEGIPI